jgi:transcription elongation GreA/GreB family factor
MSRAFVKERDGDNVFEDVPDRPIGADRNLVTPRGLALIEAEVARLRTALADAQAQGERGAIGEASRDLRYWSMRLSSAELVAYQTDVAEVRFGHRVRIRRHDGREQVFQIVGVDEADPAKGLISYISPLAESLIGGRVGEKIEAGQSDAEIVAIEPGSAG